MDALTDRTYWDEVWLTTDGALGIDAARDLHHAHIERMLEARLGPGRRFLEIGAGGSAWPAHAAARFGAEAWGIDFSRTGLALAGDAAVARGVRARVKLVEGDLFDRGRLPFRSFHVIYSGGFLEHFRDPAPVVERMAELLAPDGWVVTTVPNLAGLNGWLQRRVDPECFARHVVFTPESLDAAHAAGGLRAVEPAGFVGVLDVGAVNFARSAARLPPLALRALWAGLTTTRRIGEGVASLVGARDGGRWLAPSLGGAYAQ
jgi:SAM-dependent methyltransferase